jgi:hypothetical protein
VIVADGDFHTRADRIVYAGLVMAENGDVLIDKQLKFRGVPERIVPLVGNYGGRLSVRRKSRQQKDE